MMERIWQDGPLDVLMNNAAGNFIARAETLSPRAFDSVLNIVLHGTAYCTLAAGRRWIAAGRPGTILSIVTTAAFTGGPYTAPSAAAKAGVMALMRSLAVEWGPKRIRTAAVAPGLFPTKGAWDRLYPANAQPEPMENSVPLRRVGEHTELANLCAYLVSDQASYITGECVIIDGGRWMQGVGGNIARNLEGWTDTDWERFRKGA
jgi:NAD(P)-dependent dehydrogenase (short-subunit alcohol dehydrogenase family)